MFNYDPPPAYSPRMMINASSQTYNIEEQITSCSAFGRCLKHVAAHNFIIDTDDPETRRKILDGSLINGNRKFCTIAISAICCQNLGGCTLRNLGLIPQFSFGSNICIIIGSAAFGGCLSAQSIHSYKHFLENEVSPNKIISSQPRSIANAEVQYIPQHVNPTYQEILTVNDRVRRRTYDRH